MTTRQYLAPGIGYINESGTRQYLGVRGYANETVLGVATATAAITEDNDTASAASNVLVGLSISRLITRQYLQRVQANETGIRQYFVPGIGYINESRATITSILEDDDTSTASASVRVTTSAAIPESDDVGGSTHTPYTLDFSASLPAGFTYLRSDDQIATVIDGSGKLQLVAANSPRFHHDLSGVAQGIFFEDARTNKSTNYNAVPTDTTGLSVTGSATVSVVSDTAAISAAKLDAVVTGSVIEASGGAGGGTVIIAGATGATGAFSASLYARVTIGTSATLGITSVPVGATISGSPYTRILAENLTAANTDTALITIPAGTTIRFILNQLEAGTFATSVIKVSGSSATRNAATMQLTGLDTATWFNASEGTAIASVNPLQANEQVASAAIMVASSGGSFPTDALWLQTNNISNKPSAFIKASNVSANVAVLTGVIPGRQNPVGMIWHSGADIEVFAGPMVTGPYPAPGSTSLTPTGITTLNVGTFANGGGSFNGCIKTLTFFKVALTVQQCGPYSLGAFTGHTERGVIGGGQSNMQNNSAAPPDSTNGGELAMVAYLDSHWGTSTRNWFINAAEGGTSFTAWQGSGAALARWKTTAAAYVTAGGIIEGILWDQGEADLGYTVAQYKTAYLGIFQAMVAYLVSLGCTESLLKVIIRPLGRYRLDATEITNTSCGRLRQAQQELASENPTLICISPEKSFEPLVDNLVHLTDAGYSNHATLLLRKLFKFKGDVVSGEVDGPTISMVRLSGNTWTAQISPDTDGTDFTPTSGIGGFRFYDNGTYIASTSVVRASANTIAGTLASTPSTTNNVLTYAWGTIYDDDGSTLVRDNSTYGLPLRAGSFGITDLLTAGAVEDDDVATVSSHLQASSHSSVTEDDDSLSASIQRVAILAAAIAESDDTAGGALGVQASLHSSAAEGDDSLSASIHRLVVLSAAIVEDDDAATGAAAPQAHHTPATRRIAIPVRSRTVAIAARSRTVTIQ